MPQEKTPIPNKGFYKDPYDDEDEDDMSKPHKGKKLRKR